MRYSLEVSNAAERKRRRMSAWTSEVFRGPGALAALEEDALEEWRAMDPLARLALAWQLSLEQYGGADVDAMEPRLPRSRYRVERR